jgi:hypothetical protein
MIHDHLNMQRASSEEQLLYWKNKLQDLSHLQLYTDLSRPPLQRFSYETIKFAFDQNLTIQLQDLSHIQGTSLYPL